MIFNMTGGGGNPLNFKVVGGTTAPSNPKENTIWVNTGKEITGWHFSSAQPDDMKEGEVWFYTGKSSVVEFNALKKNNVTVYPQTAKQMVSGTLKDVTAKSYQNGEWVGWIIYLYNAGDECKDITGGWTSIEHTSVNDGTLTITRNDTTMDITLNAYWRSCSVYTANKIDVSNCSELKCNFESATSIVSSDYINFGLFSSISEIGVTESVVVNIVGKTGEVALDTSNISGEYYVGFFIRCSKQPNEGYGLLKINGLSEVSLT